MLSVTMRGAYRNRMASRLAAHMDPGPIDYGASRRAMGTEGGEGEGGQAWG